MGAAIVHSESHSPLHDQTTIGIWPDSELQSETTERPERPKVTTDEFESAMVDLKLIDPLELRPFVEAARGDVSRLSRELVRAGKLTSYQAGALAQGKAKGLLIGKYLVQKKIGQGGMGVVFMARHSRLGHTVAIKILPPSFARNAESVLRFRREVLVVGKINHPNVVSALDADEDRGVHFLAMQFIEGHNLHDLVREKGPLSVKLTLDCVIQAARGLEAAHAQGIVHRDIKPGNLMLDASGIVRVLDLGLARVTETTSVFGAAIDGSLTQSGAFMGTVDFMAPEQAENSKKADHRADIYSLGCTIHYLLTGRAPFGGDTVLRRLMAHQQEPPPSLLSACADVPTPLEAIYQKMMAKQPGDRQSSMTELIGALEECRKSARDAVSVRNSLMTFGENTVVDNTARRPRERPAVTVPDRTEPAGTRTTRGDRSEKLARREDSRALFADENKIVERPIARIGANERGLGKSAAVWLTLAVITLPVLFGAGYLLFSRSSDTPEAPPPPKAALSVDVSETGPGPVQSDPVALPIVKAAETPIADAGDRKAVTGVSSPAKPSSTRTSAAEHKKKTEPILDILVGSSRSASHKSIATALRDASPRARIRIEPGRYLQDRTLVVTKPVEIIGLGSAGSVVVETAESAGDAFLIKAPGVTVRNLTVIAHRLHAIMNVELDTLVEDCDLSGSHNVVYTGNINTLLTLRRCKIHGSINNGIWANGNAFIDECEIYENRWAGVLVEATTNFVIRGSQIHNNGNNGVPFKGDSAGTVEDCTIFLNKRSGIHIYKGGTARVIRSRINRNEATAITAEAGTKLTMEGNDLTRNRNGATALHPSAKVVRKENRIR
jgi:serine/threonine protein kinase